MKLKVKYLDRPPEVDFTKVNGSDALLRDARAELHDNLVVGSRCPCCDQFAKIYKRKLPRATVLVMIRLWRRNEGRWYVFVPKMLDTMTGTAAHGGDGTKGQLWGLMEQRVGVRDDSSTRVGWWRLTDLGREFVQGNVKVPKYAHVYNGYCLKTSGPDWSIRQALGTKFNYDELMSQ